MHNLVEQIDIILLEGCCEAICEHIEKAICEHIENGYVRLLNSINTYIYIYIYHLLIPTQNHSTMA